jgi:hypothetical protein
MHLRRGSYRSLPHSRSAGSTAQSTSYAALAAEDALGLGPGEDSDVEGGEVLSLPTMNSAPRGHNRAQSRNKDVGQPRAGGRGLAEQMQRGIADEEVLFDEEDEDIGVPSRPQSRAQGR